MPCERDEILKTLSENSQALRELGVLRLELFGSAARGDEGADSDLDFIVEFRTKTFDAYMDLKFFLEDLFDRPVDLVLPDTIKPRLKAEILKETVGVPGL